MEKIFRENALMLPQNLECLSCFKIVELIGNPSHGMNGTDMLNIERDGMFKHIPRSEENHAGSGKSNLT